MFLSESTVPGRVCVLCEWGGGGGGNVSEFDRHFLSSNMTAPSKIKSEKKI